MGWVSAIGRQIAKEAGQVAAGEGPVAAAVKSNAGPATLGGGIGALLPADSTEERLANIAALAGGAVTARTMLKAPKALTPAEQYRAGPGVEAKQIFAGEQSRTAPLPKLERAKALEAAGAEPRAIWQETGWLRGEEGAWKYEIDDSKAAMIVDPPKVAWEFDLADMFDHPELFDAYPELKQAQIMFKDMGPVVRDQTGEIVQGATGAYDAFFRTVIINNRLTREEAAEAAIHEIQHGVQDIEGFARGGEPTAGKEYMDTPEIERAMVRLGDLKLKHDRATDPLQKQMILAQMNTLKGKIQEQAEIEYYRRLPGEVEARLSERRRKMEADQRAGIFPKEQYDVAPSEDMGGGRTSMQLIGPKAKSANQEILGRAKAMAKETVKAPGLFGKRSKRYTRQQIWDETAKMGQPWYQDADGNWISEIEDGVIVVRDGKGKMSEVIEFPSIYAEYPAIGRMTTDTRSRVKVQEEGGADDGAGIKGSFSQTPFMIGVNIRIADRTSTREYTVTHEVQHAVDSIEGREMGRKKPYYLRDTERRAFNTMYRRLMTMEERIARPPWETEDEAVRWWGAWRDMEAAPAKFTPPGTPDPGPTIVPAEKTMPQARPDENVPEAAGNRDLGMEGEIVRGTDYGDGKRADMKIHAPITALLGRTFLSVRELVRAATKNEQLAEIVGTATSRTRAEENKAVKAAESALSDRLMDMDAPLEAQPAAVRAFFEQMIEEQQARPDLVEGGYDYTQPGYFDGLRLNELIRELAFAQSAEAGIRDPMVDMIQRMRAAGIVGGKYVPGGRSAAEDGPPQIQSIVIFDERAPALLTDQSGNLMSRRGGPLMDEFGTPPKADPFYSALGRFVESNTTKKAPASQWKGMIANAPGIKAEEVEWTGVNEWLDAQEGPVAREDLAAFLAGNGVQVEEVVRGGGSSVSDKAQRQMLPLIERRDELQSEIEREFYTGVGPDSMDDETRNAMFALEREVDDLTSQIDNLQRTIDLGLDDAMNDTKWSSYTLPGGENYREMLLTLPEVKRPITFEEYWEQTHVNDLASASPGAIAIAREAYEKTGQNLINPANYRSSHWSEPNVLAHVRFKERTGPNGERVLALEEIQSDWHQAGREQGYASAEAKAAVDKATADGISARTEMIAALMDPNVVEKINARGTSSEKEMLAMVQRGMHVTDQHLRTMLMNFFRDPSLPDGVGARMNAAIKAYEASDAAYRAAQRAMQSAIPNAPFKNNAWAELVLKRMIRWAAENGFDSVAWIPGNVQNGRIVDAADNRGDFYDKIIPNIANKLGKKYGAKTTKISVDTERQTSLSADRSESITQMGSAEMWSLPITPELRAAAVEQGFPMFSKRGGPLMEGADDTLNLTEADKIAQLSPDQLGSKYRPVTGAIGEAALWAGFGAGVAGAAGIALGWDGIQRTNPEKPPEDMTPEEFARWKAQEAAAMQAERAAAREQRDPAPSGYNPFPMTEEAEANMAQTDEMLAIKERRRLGLPEPQEGNP